MNYLMAFPHWDIICSACIDFMYQMARVFDISYACANVLLFVLIQPAAILLLLVSTLLALFHKQKASVAFLIAGTFIVLVEVAMLLITLISYFT